MSFFSIDDASSSLRTKMNSSRARMSCWHYSYKVELPWKTCNVIFLKRKSKILATRSLSAAWKSDVTINIAVFQTYNTQDRSYLCAFDACGEFMMAIWYSSTTQYLFSNGEILGLIRFYDWQSICRSKAKVKIRRVLCVSPITAINQYIIDTSSF